MSRRAARRAHTPVTSTCVTMVARAVTSVTPARVYVCQDSQVGAILYISAVTSPSGVYRLLI